MTGKIHNGNKHKKFKFNKLNHRLKPLPILHLIIKVNHKIFLEFQEPIVLQEELLETKLLVKELNKWELLVLMKLEEEKVLSKDNQWQKLLQDKLQLPISQIITIGIPIIVDWEQVDYKEVSWEKVVLKKFKLEIMTMPKEKLREMRFILRLMVTLVIQQPQLHKPNQWHKLVQPEPKLELKPEDYENNLFIMNICLKRFFYLWIN